jgi:hypothetical protein
LGAAFAVDDHAEPGEHRVEWDQEADRAGGDEGLVGGAGVERLFERGCDHDREQDRGEQGHDQLAGGANAELESSCRQRRERRERVVGALAAGQDRFGADGGHVCVFLSVSVRRRRRGVHR